MVQGTFWKVGDGISIKVFSSKWIPETFDNKIRWQI